MKFLRIQIKNLFAYRAATFDFPSVVDEDKNVILIHGRNGHGKTSFINSLKLFFLGSDDTEMRNASRGRMYTTREYMLGSGPEWEGAFNRRALADKETSASVAVTWQEKDGVVTATRSWTIDGPNSVTEWLEIDPEYTYEEGAFDEFDLCQAFLDKRLPRSLVPLFIYDAEQVQRIAESNSEAGYEQIVRLLDITSLNTAETFLERVVTKLKRESDASSEQYRYEKLRADFDVANAEKIKIESDLRNGEEEDSDLQRRIEELTRRLLGSQAVLNEQNESHVKDLINDRRASLEEKSMRFLESFPEVAPLVSHPSLVTSAIEKLQKVSQGRALLVDELRSILSRLPTRLFDEPQFPKPALSENQTRFLKHKAALMIEAEVEMASGISGEDGWMLPIDRARRAEEKLRAFANPVARDGFTVQLRDMSKLMREELALEAKLKNLAKLPEDDRVKQAERQAELELVKENSRQLREKIGNWRSQLTPLNRKIESLRSEVNYQERRVAESTRNQASISVANKTLAGIRYYRDSLKESRRGEIQKLMNVHLKALLDSNSQIGEVRFDENFKMTYYSSDGKIVGMGNISAGMKQIAAQAFLWALTDVAHADSPVVIDTPLARIDAGHQRLLITKFYPAAAPQVIVLPTDSELDREKYGLLKPYIAKEFYLSNPEGDSTVVTPNRAMY